MRHRGAVGSQSTAARRDAACNGAPGGAGAAVPARRSAEGLHCCLPPWQHQSAPPHGFPPQPCGSLPSQMQTLVPLRWGKRGLCRAAPAQLRGSSALFLSCSFLEQLHKHQGAVLHPDYKTSFHSFEDALQRLLPYHVYQGVLPSAQDYRKGEGRRLRSAASRAGTALFKKGGKKRQRGFF